MRYTRTWYHSTQHDNVCVFLILVVLCYVLIHISTLCLDTLHSQWNITTPFCDRNSAECHIPSYSYIALLSAALSEQHPCHIAWAPVYPLLLSSQYSVDSDVDQALITLPYLHLKVHTELWNLAADDVGGRFYGCTKRVLVATF